MNGWVNERGMPILKHTLCKVGTHTWLTTGTAESRLGKDPDEELPPHTRCDCGLIRWSERANSEAV